MLLVLASSAGFGEAAPSELEPEVGYDAGQMETPRSAAMGGALRALGTSSEALFLNPANMAAARVYHLAGVAQIWPQARRQSYGGAAVDSVVNRKGIAGGLAANWTQQDADGVDRTSTDFRFAMAAPLSQKFFVGAAARYLTLAQNGQPGTLGLEPSLASGGLADEDIVNDITFDAGVTVKPTPELSIAAVGQNLTDAGHGFLPLLLGGGVGYGSSEFSIEVDALSDLTTYDSAKWRFMTGGELLLANVLRLRGGYSYAEGEALHSISGGAGYLSREFSIDASVRTSVKGPQSVALVFGFKYHIDAVGIGGAF